MGVPIDLLVMEYGAVINILQGLNGSGDLPGIPGIIIRSLVVCFQAIDRRQGFRPVFILGRHHFNRLLMDHRNLGIDLSALHGNVDGFLRE